MSPILPRPGALLSALGGFATLGLVGGLRLPEGPVAGVLLALVPTAGAVALTTPTLLVASAFSKHPASPSEMAAAPLDAFVRAGRLAFWLAPVLLVFVPAGGLTLGTALHAGVLGAGLLALVVGARSLLGFSGPAARGLALGWAAFACAVGLHLFLSPPFLS